MTIKEIKNLKDYKIYILKQIKSILVVIENEKNKYTNDEVDYAKIYLAEQIEYYKTEYLEMVKK